MAEQKAFLVPIVVDSTHDRDAFVPDGFRAVQWTRLPGGETTPAFVERIKRLLSPSNSEASAMASGVSAAASELVHTSRRSRLVELIIATVARRLGKHSSAALRTLAGIGCRRGPKVGA
jgi:hypothetical protein